MNLQASAYGYRLHDFLLGVYLPDGLLQYQNADGIQAEGVEARNQRPSGELAGGDRQLRGAAVAR